MATTCDYCHKPLSLMRRLRGEQFCSPEHLDHYTAQQAEFALERLAASVVEKPNTERPPVPKPTGKLRLKPPLNGAHTTAPVATQTIPPVAAPHEQDAVTARRSAPEIQSVEADYPMGRYLDQSEIAPRALKNDEEPKKGGFAPVETWGKSSPSWTMPPFRAEPSDPRTWNAGRLVSKIPPAAGWRESGSGKPVDAADEDIELPQLTVEEAEIPHLSVEVAPIQETLRRTEFHDAFPPRLTQYRQLAPKPGSALAQVIEKFPAEFASPQSVLTGVAEFIANGFPLPANVLAPANGVQRTGLRPQSSSFVFDEANGPQFAGIVPTCGETSLVGTPSSLLPLAATQPFELRQSNGAFASPAAFDGANVPQFSIAAPSMGGTPLTSASSLVLLSGKPLPTGLRLATGVFGAGTTIGPAAPAAFYAIPQPPEWKQTDSFSVPTVTLPELSPRQFLRADPSRAASGWREVPQSVQPPTLQGLLPLLGDIGPTFGWELSQPTGWSGQIGVNLESVQLAAALRVGEFHHTILTSLPHAEHRVQRSWATLKTDAARLNVGPLVSLRPAVTALDVQMRPLMPFKQAYLEHVGEASGLIPNSGQSPELLALGATIAIRPQFAPLAVPAARFERRSVTAPAPLALAGKPARIRQLGPVKYSPVAITVLPPPQFSIRPPVPAEEQRYVAQAPNGVWTLGRIRHTGYRALGPFPKLPLRLPDRYLQPAASEMPPALNAVVRLPLQTKQGLSMLPTFAEPNATHVHPADYWVWPTPKGVNINRIPPEREYLKANSSLPSGPAQVRRFGPGRAGLQTAARSADVLQRSRA